MQAAVLAEPRKICEAFGQLCDGVRRNQKSLELELQVMCSLAPQADTDTAVLGRRGPERRGIEGQMPDRARLLGLRKWGGYGFECWKVTGKFPAGAWCGLNYICR